MSMDPQMIAYIQSQLNQAYAAQNGGHVSGLGAIDFVGNVPGYPNVGNVPGYYAPAPVQGLDMVGAMQAMVQQKQQQAAFNQILAGQQVPIPPRGVYSNDLSGIPRRKVAGFPTGIIGIGASTVTIQMTPQEAIRPERLIIVDATTGSLVDVLVNDIKVGSSSQNVGTGPISAEFFSPQAFDTVLECETVNPGIFIAISLQLLAPAVVIRQFNVSMSGRSAKV